MIEEEVEHGATAELTAEMIRTQLDLLVRDDAFRSSKRSVAFLKYVVEETLLNEKSKNLQIVLGTTVTDGTPGPPKVLAISAE